MKRNEDFFEYLDQIREKPGMFLGEPSLTFFYFYLLGFFDAQPVEKRKDYYALFKKFSSWVEEYYQYDPFGKNWYQTILEQEKTEVQAFYQFFKLFKKFNDGGECVHYDL